MFVRNKSFVRKVFSHEKKRQRDALRVPLNMQSFTVFLLVLMQTFCEGSAELRLCLKLLQTLAWNRLNRFVNWTSFLIFKGFVSANQAKHCNWLYSITWSWLHLWNMTNAVMLWWSQVWRYMFFSVKDITEWTCVLTCYECDMTTGESWISQNSPHIVNMKSLLKLCMLLEFCWPYMDCANNKCVVTSCVLWELKKRNLVGIYIIL